MMQKTILVTGGAGFIGTNFIRYVFESHPEWRVVNLDALTYAGNPANLADLDQAGDSRYRFVHGDIADRPLVERIMEEESPRGVLHFAAESHVDRSIRDPEIFVKTNVLGTFHLLEASLRYWERTGRRPDFRFVHVSTDEVFGSLGPSGLFTEKTPYDPSSPYSASKASSDHFVRAYFRTFGLPAVITNCSNNFGPFQFPEKLMPLMILNIMNEKPLPVYGDGRNVRDWLFVIDHCSALFRVFEAGVPGETYNVGGNSEKENIAVVHALCDIMDRKLGRPPEKGSRRLIQFITDRPGHDRRYAIDGSKIRRELGWTPRYPFTGALEQTVDWYLANLPWVESVQSGAYRSWIEKHYGIQD